MGLSPGAKLGGYEIVAPIGAGGMGEVYRARDPKLRREVAIKILPAAFAADPDRLARFEREAHAVAALSHPNILAIHDFGSDSGITYAVMELLDGQTLRDVLRAGARPRRKAVDYAAQIAKALDAAHARGIVHRDLKPENVFDSSGGHVKVLDFGLAVHRAPASAAADSVQTTEGATHAGTVLGTAGYMSPEQVRGGAADHRSDIFSFGCVLYEMLSGARAFEGESSIDILHATLRTERAPTENAEAYELYLKARTLSVAIPKQNLEGIELLQQAVARDPRFALAYSAMARRYNFVGYVSGSEAFERGIDAARTAIAIDPQLARAHYSLAICLGSVGRMDESRLAMQRAIELDANFWSAFEDLSLMETNAGRLDQALYWAMRGLPLGPNIANSYYHLGLPLLLLDDVATERWLRAAMVRFPMNDPTGGQRLRILMAIIELRRGQPAAAIEQIRAAVASQPEVAEGQTVLTEMTVFTGAPDARERVDKALNEAPGVRSWYTPYTPRAFRAYLWMTSGDRARARPLIDAAIAANRAAVEAGDRSFMPPYENVALHLMRGDRTAALESLDRAITAGWRDAEFLKRDPLIAPLASEPRFAEIVERINRDVAEMRKRVDLRELDEWARNTPSR